MCLEMKPSWCRQVKWGNRGIPWVNCTVLCVKDYWKGQAWGPRYCPSKPRSLLVFQSGMTSHSKIAQFNWKCTGALRRDVDIRHDFLPVLRFCPTNCASTTVPHVSWWRQATNIHVARAWPAIRHNKELAVCNETLPAQCDRRPPVHLSAHN
jgi:hypothetical protein